MAKVHGLAASISHPSIVERLQEHVPHIGMRLLELIEENNAERLASDSVE